MMDMEKQFTLDLTIKGNYDGKVQAAISLPLDAPSVLRVLKVVLEIGAVKVSTYLLKLVDKENGNKSPGSDTEGN